MAVLFLDLTGEFKDCSSGQCKLELYVMAGDGSQRRQLSGSSGLVWNAQWSPDGKRIAFDLEEADRGAIYTVAVDGGEAVKLSDGRADDRIPFWAPDGRKIVFRSNRHGNGELYSISSKGGQPTRLAPGINQDDNSIFPADWSAR